MIKFIALKVGQMAANCYLLYEEGDKECVIVDPGDDAEFLISKIQENELKPKIVVATHAHFDHITAVIEIKLAYSIPFAMNKKDDFLLKMSSRSAKYFTNVETLPAPVADKNLEEGDMVKVGRSEFVVLEVPGHTPGSIALYEKEDKLCVVGDLIFSGGYTGRTDLSYSDYDSLNFSIDKILKLPGDTTVLSGHGESFKISDFAKHWQS